MMPENVSSLRLAAEERLKQRLGKNLGDVSSVDLPRLLQELQIHQIELEMQNEELLQAQKAAEEARDNFLDLYELAPITYITLDAMGLIRMINLTGAGMLAVDRATLLRQHFPDFVADPDKARWNEKFRQLLTKLSGVTMKLALEMVRADGSTFPAHLVCLKRQKHDAEKMIRIAVFDLSAQEK